MKYSIKIMLVSVGFVGLVLASLKYGGWMAWVATGLIAVFALAMIIVVCVGNRARRAFATGFLIPFFAYLGIHYFSSKDEGNLYDSNMPTTQMVKAAYDKVRTREYYDRDTGEILVDFDPDETREPGAPRRRVSWNTTPERRSFAILGHACMALIPGLAGGFFALRVRDESED